MTKLIFLLRHSQSAGKQTGLQDYERILTPEGEALAEYQGNILQQRGFVVDLILSSAAVRSVQTVEHLNKSLLIPADKIQFHRAFYEAMMVNWLDTIAKLPDDLSRVMLVGHNPWLSMLAGHFAGTTIELMPCELIGFEFESSQWKDIGEKGHSILRLNPNKP